MVTDREVLTEFIHARLNRAGDHLDELKRDVADVYTNSDRARIVTDINADRTEVSINIVYRRPHPNRRWGVLVGDFAHCVRSALDNTVYAIALTTAAEFPPPDDRILAFPIADTEDDWGRVKRIIRTLPEDVRTIIKAEQPCYGGDWRLGLLGSLNNMDKHRLPVVAHGTMREAGVTFNTPYRGRLIRQQALRGPAITEAPLVILTFSEPQPAETDVNLKISGTVFLSHAGGLHEAFKTLQETRFQAEAVIEKLRPFIL